MEEIENDYGKEQKDSVIFWLGGPLHDKLIDLPENKIRKIENTAKARIEELKKEYIENKLTLERNQ